MMKLGLFVQGQGHHIAAWRHPSTPYDASTDFHQYKTIARMAEDARFDMIFLADTVATFGPDDPAVWKRTASAQRLEPLTLLAALASITQTIGFVATATTTYSEPFAVARAFASLDKISEGRAGWNLVTSTAPSEAYNFGHDAHPPHEARYARAQEFAQVVLGLWDTWEDDAFVEDKANALYFTPEKLHMLHHKGAHFSVRGPLTVRRSPQGRPVLVQAGQSEPGRALAAATAEVIFTVQQDIDAAKAFREDIRARAAQLGRSPDSIKVMPGVVPFVAATRAQAQEKFDALQALIHPELGVRILSELVAVDLSKHPLDGPMPEAPAHTAQLGRQQVILDTARREKLTIRQVYERVVGARGHRIVIGAGADIADQLEAWWRAGAADGFNIMPPTFPEGLSDFITHVLPELRRRGIFRTAYEGKTLRENLGLPFPARRRASAPQHSKEHA